MKVIDLALEQLSVPELLKSARHGTLLVKSVEGDQFVISMADNFASEVELLRHNHNFLTFLDSCKQEQKTISLAEAEKRLV